VTRRLWLLSSRGFEGAVLRNRLPRDGFEFKSYPWRRLYYIAFSVVFLSLPDRYRDGTVLWFPAASCHTDCFDCLTVTVEERRQNQEKTQATTRCIVVVISPQYLICPNTLWVQNFNNCRIKGFEDQALAQAVRRIFCWFPHAKDAFMICPYAPENPETLWNHLNNVRQNV